MSSIVPVAPAVAPVPISVELDRQVRVLRNKLVPSGVGYEIAATDAPSDVERAALEQRVVAIARWMAPPLPSWIVKQLMALALVRPPAGGTDDEREKALKITVNVLSDLPQFALAKAFEAAHRGEVGKPAFMPSPAELRVAACRLTDPLSREKRRIQAVLTAQIGPARLTPEERKAVAAAARAAMRQGTAEASLSENAR